MTDIQCIVKDRATVGETPIWSPIENALYWVDIRKPAINRHVPATKAFKTWPAPADVGSIGLARNGRLIAALRTGLHFFDPRTGGFALIHDPEPDKPENRLNDGRVDRAGRYWCGSMKDPDFGPFGTLYRFDPDGRCTPIFGGITIINALCFSPDDRIMYFADSPKRVIWAYEFDKARGSIANPKKFAEVPEGQGVPDGATVDAHGFVWSAHMMGSRLTRYDPAGKIERIVHLPTSRTAACGFGGTDLKTLYITTGTIRMTEADLAADPLAGSLLAFEAPAPGLPEPVFGA